MSPSPELIVPDAPHSRHRGLIHPDRPAVSCKTSSWRNVGKPAHPFFSLFTLNTNHLSAENLSLTTAASCIPLSYSPPVVHFVTVCFTLKHLLSHSHSPTLIKSLSPIAASLSLSLSLLLAAFLALVNSSFSQLNPLCLFTRSSSCSLIPPRLLLFILLPRSFSLCSL